MPKFASRLTTLLASITLAFAAAPALAEPIYGITDATASSLVMFDSTTPAILSTIGFVSGIVAGQTLRAIDFRPSNGLLYGVSNSGSTSAAQLYTIDVTTGVATPVGAGFTLTGNNSVRVSIDFNPVADALRVVTGSGQSYRVNANTGALIAQDTSVDATRLIADVAYTNNVAGAASTTLYAYDFLDDTVGTIGSVGGTPVSPNSGQYFTVGQSGLVTFSAAIGFDISGGTGLAYLSLDDNRSVNTLSEFYRLNLATGSLMLVGTSTAALLDISVGRQAGPLAVPEPETLGLLAIGLLSIGFATRRRRIG